MKPVSIDQYEAALCSTPPPIETVREGIWSVPFDMPAGHVPYSLGYVIDDFSGGLHLVDPGWPTDGNWARLTTFLTSIGKSIEDVATVTATHLHPDHLGLGGTVREISGAKLVLHHIEDDAAGQMRGASSLATASERFDDWGVPMDKRGILRSEDDHSGLPVHGGADVRLADGDLLPIPGRSFVAILTPGHTTGHICIHDREEDLLLSGDHVMPKLRGGLGLGASSPNPVGEYLTALDRIASFDSCEIAPGHEYRFRGLAERCVSTAAHHVRRSREVRQAMEADGNANVWTIASRLTWKSGFHNLRGDYAVSALAQTQMQMDFIRSNMAEAYLSNPALT